MRKFVITMASAAALATAPAMLGQDVAEAGGGGNIWKGIIGGMIVGAIISHAVRAGQSHCHPGYGCHSHGAAGPYHYHDAYGRIIYGGPTYAPAPPPQVYQPAPPPVYGGYSSAHYSWCASRYQSYDPGSNSWQPFGNVPRRQCISPYM